MLQADLAGRLPCRSNRKPLRAAAAALRALGASLGRRKLAADLDRAPADAGPAGAAAEWSLWAARNGRPGRF